MMQDKLLTQVFGVVFLLWLSLYKGGSQEKLAPSEDTHYSLSFSPYKPAGSHLEGFYIYVASHNESLWSDAIFNLKNFIGK